MADVRTNPRQPRNPEREAAIEAFLTRFADCLDRDLLAEMMVTVCRLAKDRTGRGELKLLSRAFKELRYAFKIFKPYAAIRKVSIFGSSRTPIGHPDYVQADRFARRMRESDWMIITGAGDGIMRAGHVGAGREASFGVAISLPFEQKANTIIANDPKLINFKYFFTRKLIFVKEASAIALFPGGFGTQDEGFEALTLVQTGKDTPVPIVLVDAPGGTYWQHWRTYVTAELLRTGMIDEDDMHLFRLTDDVEVAVREIVHFYHRYHSARYVGDTYVLRLNTPLPDRAIEELNDKYGAIVSAGRIEQSPGPLPGEHDEYPDKPRLVFAFNRHSAGRLRLMIDDINNF
jgi:hypothetical protein